MATYVHRLTLNHNWHSVHAFLESSERRVTVEVDSGYMWSWCRRAPLSSSSRSRTSAWRRGIPRASQVSTAMVYGFLAFFLVSGFACRSRLRWGQQTQIGIYTTRKYRVHLRSGVWRKSRPAWSSKPARDKERRRDRVRIYPTSLPVWPFGHKSSGSITSSALPRVVYHRWHRPE